MFGLQRHTVKSWFPLFLRCAASAVALVPMASGATYSIVATDSATAQIGGAGTSCVGTLSVRIIYGPAPGHGAIHAQATINLAGRNRGAALLMQDVDPVDIIADITDPAFDPRASVRQYGVVDLSGRSAGFTGEDDLPFAADQQGNVDSYTYSVQGNILTSANVLNNAEQAFLMEGCDLADKLMLALEAGARDGEGDSRCTPRGIPSDSAFIEVDDDSGEGSLLRIEITNTGTLNPLIPLREQFDAWRKDHPCP